jgi:ABC-2 type transport system ATP-binding protein
MMTAATMLQDSPALDITEVSHRFGARKALDAVTLLVGRGQFTALLGPNGAGKTTLFSIITRLYSNRSGQVRIFGRDLQREPSAALAEMGVVFQTRTLDLDLTVRQNLGYHASLHGIAGRVARERIDRLLARVGLTDRAKDKVRTLSGGQSRRIEIARSLIHAPRLLLLDEATVGLDLASRADIVRIVRDLVREDGLSVLWATHIFDEVEPSDSVYVLHGGKIIAQGRSEDISAKADGASLAEAFRALTEDTTETAR